MLQMLAAAKVSLLGSVALLNFAQAAYLTPGSNVLYITISFGKKTELK